MLDSFLDQVFSFYKGLIVSIKKYFRFVEIQTSALSLFGFALSAVFIYYYLGHWNLVNATVFFVAEMIMDNMITGINNVMDYIMAKDEKSRNDSVIVKEDISIKIAFIYIIGLMTISAICGVWLCWRTNWLLFFMGGLLFLIVGSYTSGPFPISRMPIGEFVSGIAQGFGVPFLFAYVNDNFKQMAILNFYQVNHNWNFTLTGSLTIIIAFILLCYPSMALTANVMLANNMSDHEQDRINARYTLPVVFGMKKAAILYKTFAYSQYFAIILMVILKMAPTFYLLTLLTFPKVRKNVNTFVNNPQKRTTFPTALENYRIVVGMQTITMLIGALVHF